MHRISPPRYPSRWKSTLNRGDTMPPRSTRLLLAPAVFDVLALLLASGARAGSAADTTVPVSPSTAASEPTTTCSKVTAPPHLCEVDVNATRTFRRFPEPDLIPWPASITASAAYTTLTPATTIVSADAVSRPLAKLLASELAALTGGALDLTISTTATPGAAGTTITLVIAPSGSDRDNFYSLAVSSNGAALAGTSYAGLAAATTTLLQASGPLPR